MVSWTRALWICGALLACAAPGVSAPASRAEAFQHLEAVARRQGSVNALVQLRVPGLAALRERAVRSTTAAASSVADEALARAIRGRAEVLRSLLSPFDQETYRTYRTLPFLAMRLSAPALEALEPSAEVLTVLEDVPRPPALDVSVPLVGAPAAWDAGLDGAGWHVAVLDTGLLATHDFFTGKEIVQACFARGTDMSPAKGDCPNGKETDTTSPDAARQHPSNFNFYAHGTLVAGVAVGNDPDPFNVPRYGVARAADLIAVQVYSRFESDPLCGGATDCVLSYDSDQIAALEYVFSLRNTYDIAAVNMSIGSGRYFDQASCDAAFAATEAAVANLRAVGIPTVISSGNNGFCDSLNGPACVTSAIAVGATDDADAEASFSNYHPDLLDLFAPGVAILSSAGTGDGDYVSAGGTSLAAPHVAGAWALMRQALPTASVDDILMLLQSSGESALAYRCGGADRPSRLLVPGAAGAVPDGQTVPGAPLQVSGDGTSITLTWGSSCAPGDTDYAVYEGSIAGLFDHTARACTTGGLQELTLAPDAGNTYYLVVPHNRVSEGSYGHTPAGDERPAAASACLEQRIASCP